MCSPPTPCLFSKVEAAYLRGHINDSQAAPAPLLPVYELDGAPTAAQVLIMGPDDFIVAMVRYASSDSTWHKRSSRWGLGRRESGLRVHLAPISAPSSLNRPFGSGLITPSGILLNSQMLDFSWPNRTANHSAPSLVGSCFPPTLGTPRLGRMCYSMAAPPSLFPLGTSIIKKRSPDKVFTSPQPKSGAWSLVNPKKPCPILSRSDCVTWGKSCPLSGPQFLLTCIMRILASDCML